MKKLIAGLMIAIVAFAALTITVNTQAADTYNVGSGTQTILDTSLLPGKGLTNGASGSSWAATTNIVWLDAAKDIAIQAYVDGTATATNLVMTIYKSLDGSKWDAFNQSPTLTVTPGTTPMTLVTNYTINAVRALKFEFTTSTAVYAKPLTNTTVKVYWK